MRISERKEPAQEEIKLNSKKYFIIEIMMNIASSIHLKAG